MLKKTLIIFLLVLTLSSCTESSSVRISDSDVIEFITKSYDISKPDGFRITNGLEFLYTKFNRYYIFREHTWVDEGGKTQIAWVYSGWGYIDRPVPSTFEVQMELLFISKYLEEERMKLREKLEIKDEEG